MHKSENEKIDFILDEHERIFRKQGSLCMAPVSYTHLQTEFNKLLLECVVKTQSTVAKILGIESLSPHVSGNPKFEYANMVEDIREKVSSEMERFFPKNDEE